MRQRNTGSQPSSNMFSKRMTSVGHVTPGNARLITSVQTSEESNFYFPLTPEEVTPDPESLPDPVVQEVTPCFPLTPDELDLDSSPPILAQINSCYSLEEMNFCSPYDHTLRELNLCSPVTPGDVDLCSPHTPLDFNFAAPQGTSDPSLNSPVIPTVTNRASSVTPSDCPSAFSSVSHSDLECSPVNTPGDVGSSPEDWQLSSPSSPLQTVTTCSPVKHTTSLSALSQESGVESSLGSEGSPGEASSPTRPKLEFLTLNHTELLGQGPQSLLLPSKRVDPSATSTPYTDAAQARKPARQGHIKRPMNAFMIWAQQQRHQIIAQYPGSDNAKISKFLGSTWKKMNDQEKAPFREEADRLKLLHVKEFPEYKYKPRKAAKRKPSKTEPDASEATDTTSSSAEKKNRTKKKATVCSTTAESRNSPPPRRGRRQTRRESHRSASDLDSPEPPADDGKNLASVPQSASPPPSRPMKSAQSVGAAWKSVKLESLGAIEADEVKGARKQVIADDFRRVNEVTGSEPVLPFRREHLSPNDMSYPHPNIVDHENDVGEEEDDDDDSSSSSSSSSSSDTSSYIDNDNMAKSNASPACYQTAHANTSDAPSQPEVSTTRRSTLGPEPSRVWRAAPSHSSGRNPAAGGSPSGHGQRTGAPRDFPSSSPSEAPGEPASGEVTSSSDGVALQEFSFSEDELDQLFATSADDVAFISLVKYVMC